MRSLDLIERWPVPSAGAAVVRFDGIVHSNGSTSTVFRLASLSKVIVAWSVLVAVEEGSLALDDAIGQPGCTLRHLLCHAGGYGFEGPEPVATPGRRRIYSNTGIEMAADAVADATGIPIGDYIGEALLQPLGMSSTELRGSAAHGMWGSVDDFVRFVGEIAHPTLLADDTVANAISPQFPDLAGVIPGLGTYRPCPWGLGPEVRGDKAPHWTGSTNSPQTFGHFGGAGTMFWIDPVHEISLIALTDRKFDDWADDALRVWPELSDAVLAEDDESVPTT